eukprot:2106758-Rhodomonas_salina.1
MVVFIDIPSQFRLPKVHEPVCAPEVLSQMALQIVPLDGITLTESTAENRAPKGLMSEAPSGAAQQYILHTLLLS